MKYTSNYNLKKPDPDDFYDIVNENDNMDAIDEALTKIGKSSLDTKAIPLSEFCTIKNSSILGTPGSSRIYKSGNKIFGTLHYKNISIDDSAVGTDIAAITIKEEYRPLCDIVNQFTSIGYAASGQIIKVIPIIIMGLLFFVTTTNAIVNSDITIPFSYELASFLQE